ncbi:fibronectin type III domain-containing protein [Paenibacillus sp. N3.4]|uniref:beta strand repeat-containing protein n=1 Tax=Paenibacillus sp. N3.4 TaxID=2603222 RepID=UPI0021C3A7C6|nr:fibronectin type III domain-containing protein [Paenibacillus sp. N3.4]
MIKRWISMLTVLFLIAVSIPQYSFAAAMSWQLAGSAGFSAGAANYTSIAIDSSGTPYVVYEDYGNSYKATVKKYNGSSWVTVGSAGFSAGTANFTSIAIDSSSGTPYPYVVYQDSGNSNKATVMKYNGSSWVTVGSAGFSAGSAHYTSIAIDSSGTPYVVSQDAGNSFKATVMKLISTYTVSYSGNGSTGGSVPTDSGTYEQGTSVTVLGNTGSLSKTGYTFAGWNTALDGSGTNYAASAAFNMGTANVTLYAQWTAPAPAQTVSASAASLTPGVGVDDAITLTVKNALGNTDTTFTGAHNVTLSGYAQAPDNTYGSFNGTALTASPNTISVTFASGIATANLKLNKAAAQTIGLSMADVATPAANTLSITPAAGVAASLALIANITAPASNGGAFAQQPVVTLRDAYGNTSVKDSATIVTVSKKDSGMWTLTGTSTSTASSGVATFTDLGATNVAGVTGAQLAFDASGLTQIASASVSLPAPAPAQTVSASAASLTPGAGVDDAITLTVKNALGNTDTTFTGAHNVTLSGYAQAPDNTYGSFNGTALTASPNTISVTFASGIATANLKLNKAAAQTIGLSMADVATPAANTLSVTPAAGSAATFALSTNITTSASNGGAFAQQPVVTLHDAYGNTSVNDSTTVVTVSKKDSGTWTLTGTATATASSGVATFTDLGATNVAGVTGAQLAFDATGLTQITSAAVTLPAPAPAQTVSASAASLTPGVGIDDAITLTVKDSLGNTDTTFTGAYNVTLSGYTQAPDTSYGSFNGTSLTATPNTISVTFASGVGTANLKLNKAASQTIGLSMADVATPGANTLSVTPAAGVAASLALTANITAPASNGGAFAQQPVVTLRDAYGNTSVNDSTTIVTVSKKDSGTWTLTGTATATATATASSGVATFTDLGATNAAEVTGAKLAFDAGSMAQITSTAVTLPWPGAAAPSEESVTAGDGHVLLTWSEVYGSVSYAVYQRTASGTYGAAVATVTGLVYDIAGLTNGATYYFVVKAMNPSGISAASNEVSATPQVPSPGVPVLQPAKAVNAQVSLTWNPVIGSTGYKIFKSTTSGAYGLEATTVSGSVYSYDVTGLTNGTTYYFVVKAINPGGSSAASNEVSATPTARATVPGAPAGVTAAAGDGQATISFTLPMDNGGSAITRYEVTASPGNITVAGAASPITVTGLSNGTAYTFTVKAVNSVGKSAASTVSNIVTPRSSSSEDPAPTQPAPPSTPNTGVEVLVNGRAENAGTATTTTLNGQTVTIVAVDSKKLEDKLAAEGNHAVITIPVNTKSDVVIGELDGQMVKNMEQKQAVVQIQTGNATYTLPAQQINISALSDQLGKSVRLQDIKLRIEISKPTTDTVKIVENLAAKGAFVLVVPPLNFTVKANYGDINIEVSKFNVYVERTIAIPDGADTSKITTGVVVEPDGTVRHVPTKIVVINEKYYAK